MFDRFPLILLVCLLAACVGGVPPSLEPGKTTARQLLEQFGPPSMVWSEGDGSLQMEFARVAQGGGNFMARVAPDGVLLNLQQVLTDARVASLQPGMSRDEVRRHLGQPAKVENLPEGEVWHWPLDSQRPAGWQINAHFGARGFLEHVERSRIRFDHRSPSTRLAGQKAAPQL